jgi:hypothetical protein
MSTEAYRQRYEQLRQQVLAGREFRRAWGLNLLQKRGVAAWAKAASQESLAISPVVPPRLSVTEDVRLPDTVLPDTVQHQLAAVLAEMILRRKPELTSSFH